MLKNLKSLFTRLHRDEQGAMAVEKILLLALIALPIVIVLFLFRNKIVGWFTANSAQVNNDPLPAP